MSPWILLVLAGLFEVSFTTSLKLSENFTKVNYVVFFLVSASISFWLLSMAMKTIPLGTAYAVWVGIGAAGTALVGFVFFKDPFSIAKGFFLVLLISSIVGLKIVSAKD